MAFAVSGAVIQNVLANKLASPSIIGVNSGAGLAVTISSAAGIVGISASFFAFVGAFITVMAVTVFTRRHAVSEGTVILVGVAINSLVGAISDAVITFIPTVGIMSHDFRVGDFSAVTYARLLPAAVIVLSALLFLLFLTNELDVIGLGDRTARSVGMSTSRMRVVFLLIAAALAGGAVSVCGLMSFVGLLVPHAIRRIAGSTSRYLIPLCALFGGGFVAICDTLARTVTAPYEIPVGIIMAALGAPFFIYILIGRRRGKADA
jgi:iron complex transport system permease protein